MLILEDYMLVYSMTATILNNRRGLRTTPDDRPGTFPLWKLPFPTRLLGLHAWLNSPLHPGFELRYCGDQWPHGLYTVRIHGYRLGTITRVRGTEHLT